MLRHSGDGVLGNPDFNLTIAAFAAPDSVGA